MTLRWRALSIRARLTGWYALVLTGMLIVYATTTFVAVRHEFMEQLDERLHEDFEAAEAQLTRAPDSRVESTANRDRDEHGAEVHVYEVWSAAGEQLHRSESTFTLPPFPISSIDATYRYDTVTVGGRRWRTLASLVLAGNQTVVLRAARSEEPLRGELREILVVLALGLPLVVALAGGGGYLLARRALAPIDHLASEARRITADRLHERLTTTNPDDEIGNATGNVIELNLVTGNTNGIYIAAAVGQNVIRNNTAIGNPPIQVGNTRPETRALDIVNLSPADRTVFDRNKCLTALAAPCASITP